MSECVYFERSDGSSDQWGLKDTNTEHGLMTPDYQTLTHNHHTKHHTHTQLIESHSQIKTYVMPRQERCHLKGGSCFNETL